ncbi:methionine ABC transporter ATP-binding protein [Vagococcus vulneris]|uniref:Methionine ABC transporter ATP-binding protein n=1 Tax=Vagococcus vulneris TaxID=1977869 RepID=A0A430A140_9ENTE|nr:ATP-binding cassette domain-containing protein [Vagococcus vulneris]RSU00092.1 methionine ABC transporter ATP-binding protein [Vagococcus vulneris]
MIHLENISVTFKQKQQEIHAVKDVTLHIDKGDIFGIVGYSGAGKSTLVRVINLLQRPTGGQVIVDDVDLIALKDKDLRAERKKIGMIFQHFNLMDRRTIFDNVDFSLKYSGKSKKERQKKVTELLELVGLSDKHQAYPEQLSGGQKQRVAIARALANDPDILLCDEATSALDPKTTNQILDLLKELNQKLNLTIVLITHEMQIVKDICNRVAVMEKGQVIEQGNSVDIFSKPQAVLTQEFIRTATHLDQALEKILIHQEFSNIAENEWLVELSYVGDQTNEPLIAQLYSKFQVSTNILYGNIEIIQGIPIGSLVVSLVGIKQQREKALQYLKQENVNAVILKKSNEDSDEKVISIARGGN